MVTEIQEAVKVDSAPVWIPEFGLVESGFLDPDKKYQGRLYRLSAEATKALSELVGFTVKFDSPTVRASHVDVVKSEGNLTFEIDRNTNPTELGLRYGRDRWSTVEPPGKSQSNLRPWIKSNYQAKFLPDKVLAGLAEQLKMKPEQREHFFIRINFKDRTIGLIGEDRFVEEFPAGPFHVFALPQDHVAAIPGLPVDESTCSSRETKSQEPGSSPSTYAAPVAAERGAKYATYSQSEIDRMLKTQADNITNALSGKISAQQRLFQDAIASQEKSFAKLADRLASEVDETRSKLEAQTKSVQEGTRADLEQFKTQLSKELEQFRAHVNKNITPLAKTFEEKVQSLQSAATEGKENLRPLLLAVAGGLAAAIIVSAVVILSVVPKQSDITELKTELSKVAGKTSQ